LSPQIQRNAAGTPQPEDSLRVPAPLFGATILLSALLLFQVQPLIAKLILPWFGGSAGVWTSCMLFFQVALLAGYAYAHWLGGRHGNKQTIIHVALLAISVLSLPILPSAAFKPAGGADPLIRIIALLSATIGLPYFLLSSTSPLLQSWYSRARGGAMPYRFFALSNFGSLLGLLTYPVLVEPYLSNSQQAWIWSGTYIAFTIACIIIALRTGSGGNATIKPAAMAEPAARPSGAEHLLRIALAAAASSLLLAVTHHLTQNVAPIPFLWVAPLSLYLLSFILCFDSDKWYRRRLFAALGAVALPGLAYLTSSQNGITDLRLAVALSCLALFVVFMICHGELAIRRPAAAFATRFYLMVSVGGAIGGLLIGLVAPYSLNALYELPFGLLMCGFFFVYLLWRGCNSKGPDEPTPGVLSAVIPLLGASLACGMAGFLTHDIYNRATNARLLVRNFYGALRVYDHTPADSLMGPIRTLQHGTITHGAELLLPQHERLATTYYSEGSGIGRAIQALQPQGAMNVGIIGLGAGTIASYARPTDHYFFYEINPDVIDIARTQFRFLDRCMAACTLLLGDARLTLESEAPHQFDVLAVDAFSGDAIPLHLLTREAFTLYWKHLKPDGVLAVHVSNNHLRLAPVVAMAAAENGKSAVVISATGNEAFGIENSEWVLVTSRPGFFQQPTVQPVAMAIESLPNLRMWTDDYSNLYKILR